MDTPTTDLPWIRSMNIQATEYGEWQCGNPNQRKDGQLVAEKIRTWI
jgi:hypothetical protein